MGAHAARVRPQGQRFLDQGLILKTFICTGFGYLAPQAMLINE
jgi:hypothetical protein